MCTYILSGGGDDVVTATALLPENGDEYWIALRNMCIQKRCTEEVIAFFERKMLCSFDHILCTSFKKTR